MRSGSEHGLSLPYSRCVVRVALKQTSLNRKNNVTCGSLLPDQFMLQLRRPSLLTRSIWARSRLSPQIDCKVSRRRNAEDVAGPVEWKNRYVYCQPTSNPCVPSRLEQRAHHRPETSAATEACLGDPGPAGDRPSDPRTGALQPRHR